MAYENNISRNLVLSDEISASTVKDLIAKIYDFNTEDDKQVKTVVNYNREPIKLIINSNGGNIYSGLALIGAIEKSVTPVYTICLGRAMSMGLWILLSGHKRYIHELATIMYHETGSWYSDKLEGVRQDLKQSEKLQEMCDRYILAKTKITKDKLDDIILKKQDWFITANEALELGIVDEIL